MSSKKPQNNQPAAGTRREQLQRQREQQAKESRVRNIVTFSILGVAVLAIVGVIVAVVLSSRNTPQAEGGGADSGNYTIVVGQDGAPVTVSIFQDFICPYCGDFERTNRDDLEAMVEDGTAKIEFHLMNFLDGGGRTYSTRAANALVEVAKAEPEHVMAFNAALYDNQPEETGMGLSDAEIADLARQSGVSNEVVATFAQARYSDWVNNSNLAAYNAGVRSTPTVKINGNAWPGGDNLQPMFQAGALRAAVDEAAAGK
jgi:protein-disulfide isomerase